MHGKGYISFERMAWKICKRFLHPGTLLKEPLAQVFSCEFSEISKNISDPRKTLLNVV